MTFPQLEDGKSNFENRLLVLSAVASTQDIARELVRDGQTDVIGVRAEYQAAGRGRGGAQWLAPPGTCLLVTYIVPEPPEPTITPWLLSLTAGLAVADSVHHLTGISPRLKWPNDVLLNGKKTAGILIERLSAAPTPVPASLRPSTVSHQPSTILIGIGLNVNVARFPPDLEPLATSLLLESGAVLHVPDVEKVVRTNLFEALEMLFSGESARFLDLWRAKDCTAGFRYTADWDGGHVTGKGAGVTDDGALILRLPSGEHITVVSATAKV